MRFQVYRPELGSPSLNAQLETLIIEFQLAFEGDAENQRALKRIESGHLQLEECVGKGYGVGIAPGQGFKHRELVGWYGGALKLAEADGGYFARFLGVEGQAQAKSYSGRHTRPARASLVGERGQTQPRVPEADGLRALEAIWQAMGIGISRQRRARGRNGAHLELRAYRA